jgi:hypothetical protein
MDLIQEKRKSMDEQSRLLVLEQQLLMTCAKICNENSNKTITKALRHHFTQASQVRAIIYGETDRSLGLKASAKKNFQKKQVILFLQCLQQTTMPS